MARIRTIKPEFWTDEKILESSPTARLLLVGILNFADDKGNIEAGANSIKAKIFPCDNLDVSELLAELVEHSLLIPYEVNGERYYNIRGFLKHQKIDNPSKPRCPLYDPSETTPGILPEDSTQEGKGREGKGKELNPSCSDSKESKPDEVSGWDLYFTNIMRMDIKQALPNHPLGNSLKTWANDLRLMRERDKRTKEEIIKVWKFANNDSFWMPNVLSANKLRKHFTQLESKMGEKKNGNKPSTMENKRSVVDDWAEKGGKTYDQTGISIGIKGLL